MGQAGMLLDFWHMLVIQVQAIHQHPLCRVQPRRLVALDRRAATAGIARHGVYRQRIVSRHQAGSH
ncbi:hypothetical protein D3C72_1974960 [compost metagenome]